MVNKGKYNDFIKSINDMVMVLVSEFNDGSTTKEVECKIVTNNLMMVKVEVVNGNIMDLRSIIISAPTNIDEAKFRLFAISEAVQSMKLSDSLIKVMSATN